MNFKYYMEAEKYILFQVIYMLVTSPYYLD